ncbi:carbohydrate ABC transporter permease [Phycicoccus sp. SLBN-51]|jgi:raffinose/stachyose/melibiose transport system permease protein|uniref:carbohydrate ABC transporter permease n=1 Tax=Phycicoccus sp. SLBN-51 TaxID=2768447 RepID=UPI0011539DEE|nr:carbohydrate ABC transporter permease [Phycicoccus sp. SLBN-51]TQJ49439.1 carbohydrate ABC transporter membrane protein 2 (CUT1 family) [Phycicoccus sp. SLBN-51]
MRVSRGERLANYAILIAFAVFALYPVLTIIVAALGPDDAAAGQVGAGVLGLHPENFAKAWQDGHFGSYLRTSVVVSVTVVVISVTLSILSGFAFGTMRFPGSTVLFYVFLLGIMMPSEAVVVPLYFDLRTLGLTDTLWAVVLPQVAQSVAFGTFWMRAYFRTSSRSLVEAARLDGASTRRILWSVLVPLARPAIVTLTVLVFMWTWNEFLIPLVMVISESLRTAPLGLAFFQGQYTQGFTLLAAGACIVATPVVLLYLFLQRHFIAGMLEGAVRE